VIRASDLIGCIVRTESGTALGRVHDLRAERGPEDTWQLTGLVIGPKAMLERLGITGANREEPFGAGRVVAWPSITRLEEGTITVSDAPAGSEDRP
jgi:sporulation protein YlmC with PRC-barrel domain